MEVSRNMRGLPIQMFLDLKQGIGLRALSNKYWFESPLKYYVKEKST